MGFNCFWTPSVMISTTIVLPSRPYSSEQWSTGWSHTCARERISRHGMATLPASDGSGSPAGWCLLPIASHSTVTNPLGGGPKKRRLCIPTPTLISATQKVFYGKGSSRIPCGNLHLASLLCSGVVGPSNLGILSQKMDPKHRHFLGSPLTKEPKMQLLIILGAFFFFPDLRGHLENRIMSEHWLTSCQRTTTLAETITDDNLGILFLISSAFPFLMTMLGMHHSQRQATITKTYNSQRCSFEFVS